MGESSALLTEKQFRSRFSRTFDYLKARKRKLESRKQFTQWFGYSAPRNLSIHDSAHLLVPLLADRGLFSILPTGAQRFCLMASGGFSIRLGDGVDVSPKYLLGLLNSRLLFAYLHSTSNVFRGGWITCTKQYVGPLPIRPIQLGERTDKSLHDRLVVLVEQMLELSRAKYSGRLAPSDPPRVEREIAATDAQIDELVYQLYDVTAEERKIIEERVMRWGMTPDVPWWTLAQPATSWLLRRLPTFILKKYYSPRDLEEDLRIRLRSTRLETVTFARKLPAPFFEFEIEVFNMSPHLDVHVEGVRSRLLAFAELGAAEAFAQLDDWGGFRLPRRDSRVIRLSYWLNEYQMDIATTYVKEHLSMQLYVALWAESHVGKLCPFKLLAGC